MLKHQILLLEFRVHLLFNVVPTAVICLFKIFHSIERVRAMSVLQHIFILLLLGVDR